MQQFLAGMAIGSIVTLAGGVFWHYHITSNLRHDLDCLRANFAYVRSMSSRLLRNKNAIINHFKNQKSGTARLAVKMARGKHT